jgi:uncharacterized protein (TIGR04255 family)
MTTAMHYGKAPIVEAIIDLRIDPLPGRELERLRDRFKGRFPSIEEMRSIKVELSSAGAVQQDSTLAGYKLTATNAADLLLINENSFATVRLAPYNRWEVFSQQAKDNFDTFTKVVGRTSVSRVGVRFVNRLDIPSGLLLGQSLSKFLKIGISLPMEVTGEIGNFSLVVEGREPQTSSAFVLRSGIVQPVIINHVSIQLDIDAYIVEVPSRLDDLWAGVERLRQAKNNVFENSITDELRRLFE